jgi:hypothetical protein
MKPFRPLPLVSLVSAVAGQPTRLEELSMVRATKLTALAHLRQRTIGQQPGRS